MRPSDFLPPWTPKFRVGTVTAAHDDLGEHEDPPGSNRGPYVDGVNDEFGSPRGSAWCANAGGRWCKRGGAMYPTPPGEADAWRRWAIPRGKWHPVGADGRCADGYQPQPGDVLLYGANDHAHHWALVEQIVAGKLLTIEANTTVIPGYDREGWIVQQKEPRSDRLGYIEAEPAEPA